MTAPPRSRRKRILRWTAALAIGVAVLYVLTSYVTSPFFESRLLGGLHPELIIGREWDPKHGWFLTIHDDLPSTCNCPLHQMLAGKEVVHIGWSRFVGDSDESLEKGRGTRNKYQCNDLAPARFILVSRQNDGRLQAHLCEQWDPGWTLRRLQNRLAGLLRYVYR